MKKKKKKDIELILLIVILKKFIIVPYGKWRKYHNPLTLGTKLKEQIISDRKNNYLPIKQKKNKT